MTSAPHRITGVRPDGGNATNTADVVRVGVYCRISKDREGRHLGVDRQERECSDFALAKIPNAVVVHVYSDNDMSQWKGKRRPQYERMLADIRAGLLDAVCAWHSDRLLRRPIEMERYIELCQPRGVYTVFKKASRVDLTTAQGRKDARQRAIDARFEVEHMSERIQEEKADAALRGDRLGGARAFGWRLVFDREEKPHRIIDEVLEPAEANLVRDGVARLLAGETVYSITKRWQASGVQPARGGQWRQNNVTRILANPRAAGLMCHKGEIVGAGNWPAIITEDEHYAVAAIVKDPKRNKYSGVRSLKWVGSGLYRCSVCGLDLRSASLSAKQRDDEERRRIYRCRGGSHINVTAAHLDNLVIETACRVLDEHGVGLLPDKQRDEINELHAEANTLNARLDELADMLGEGEIDRARYGRQREKITTKLAKITAKLEHTDRESALEGIASARQPSAAFLAQPIARQRAVIDALMTVTVKPAKKGRLPKGMDFDYSRIVIEPRAQ